MGLFNPFGFINTKTFIVGFALGAIVGAAVYKQSIDKKSKANLAKTIRNISVNSNLNKN